MDTAVVLATPSNCPMMNRSAMPYSVCKKYESRSGSEKNKMLFSTLPLVRFFSIMFSARLPSSLPNVQSLHCQTGQLLSIIDSKPYND